MTTEELFGWIEKTIEDFFSYMQRFFFLNGGRGIGKTYTLQKKLIARALKTHRQIGYVVRNRDELDDGVVPDAFEKVLTEQFPDLDYSTQSDEITYKDEDGNEHILVRGFALKRIVFYKRHSYPLVDWLLFDEYMIEKDSPATYVTGYKEPKLLLSLYDTIDRRENRVRCFFLGNNTVYYNPYHIWEDFAPLFRHQAERGEIKKISNAVFWRCEPPAEVQEYRKKTAFAQMTSQGAYGKFANDGEYEDDITAVIPMPSGAKCLFGLEFNDMRVYCYKGNRDSPCYWLSSSADPNVKIYGVRGNDVKMEIIAFRISPYYEMFEYMWNNGKVFFANQKSKTICQEFLWYILSSYRKV